MATDDGLIGISKAISDLENEVNLAANSDAKILISGESGVGKEVIARLIHHRSRRARASLVAINCAGVPDSLLESELFGHVRGSFTDAHRDRRGWLELADGGTVFLDEIGEMSLRMQALLLRFLENGEIQRVGSDAGRQTVNVRVIAATNRDLLQQMALQQFRDDLYYRLNVIHIEVPPLRERREDIAPLLNYFLTLYSGIHQSTPLQVSQAAMDVLESYHWPGNARQLRNVAERVVLRCRGVISPADLPAEITRPRSSASPGAAAPQDLPNASDELYERIVAKGESFWTVVYEPFMAHDLTRREIRSILTRGLEQSRGSYKDLVHLFNMDEDDYKRFLTFLRKHDCHLPFQRFRVGRTRSIKMNEEPTERLNRAG